MPQNGSKAVGDHPTCAKSPAPSAVLEASREVWEDDGPTILDDARRMIREGLASLQLRLDRARRKMSARNLADTAARDWASHEAFLLREVKGLATEARQLEKHDLAEFEALTADDKARLMLCYLRALPASQMDKFRDALGETKSIL